MIKQPKQKTCAVFSDTGIHKVLHHQYNETVLDRYLHIEYGFPFYLQLCCVQKTKNPNASPIRNKFGLSLFGLSDKT